jgi:hypothetical protein
MTTFKTVPVNIVGQSYEHRSRTFSIQKTMNLIPQGEFTGASESTLTTWPGCTIMATDSGANRGITIFNNELYKVSGSTLSRVSSAGSVTDIGTITGFNRCGFANDGTTLIITTGGTGYQYDGTTLSIISDSDYQNANTVAYINQQMVYDGNGGKFQVSNVGAPTAIENNNFATAESAPDDTLRVLAFNERVYLFGTDTLETWYNSGSGNPPFARVQGGTMNVGLEAIHSVATTDDYFYFLSNDNRVYRVSSHQVENITTIAVSHQLDFISYKEDAIGQIYRIEGQNIYVLTFPNGNKTFAFNEQNGAWFNLSTNADEDRYIGEDYVEIYGKRLIADAIGNIHELSLTTYTDNGEVKIQERIFGPLNGIAINAPGERFLMSWLDIIMELGVGLVTGQGTNPQLMVSASFDGGKTFSTENDVLIGRQGDGRIKARWWHCESFYDGFFRIRCSDHVFICIYGGAIGIKPSGY